jgi:hypothetical protein
MRRFFLPLGLILALLASSQSAVAGVLDSFRTGDWRGFAYSDAYRQFDRCSATKVSEGASVTYSVDRQLHWSLRLSNPNWTFIKGASSSLTLKIDDLQPVTGSAKAIDKTRLEFSPRDEIGFFADLRVAHELRAVMGGLLLHFSLDGGTETLSALTQCVTRFARYPINSKTKIFDANASPSAARAKEAGDLAKLIISYSRVPKSQIIPPENKSNFPADATWKVDALVSTRLTVLESKVSLPDLLTAIASQASRECRGGFFFITKLEQNSGNLTGQAYSSCQTLDGITANYHLVFPRPKQGHYLITEATSGSSYINTGFRLARAYRANLHSIVMVAAQHLDRGKN